MAHYDDGGNVQVDFVWGNMPMQPDDDRGTALDVELDSHEIAVYGWSNFPGYIPNYEGDGDSGLEAVVPDLVRKTVSQGNDLCDAVNLNLRANDHHLTVFYVETTGTKVRVWAYDENVSGGGYPEQYLIGLRAGDKVWIDDDAISNTSNEVTVTAVNEDGENSWFEFDAGSELNLDTNASGSVWAGSNLQNVITMQRSWNNPGDIRNEGTNIYCRYITSW